MLQEQEISQGQTARALIAKIEGRQAQVAVVGAGYVGLPLAVEKAKVGFPVVCIDRNPWRVEQINLGNSYITDVKGEALAQVVEAGQLTATTSFDVLANCDVIIICVPTPLTLTKDPDISYVMNVSAQIAKQLRPGQLVSLESTTYPGTTEEVILPLLAASGLQVGVDFFLSFSPERVDPGNARYTTKNTNKVVGGVTPRCLEVATTFYAQTILQVVPVSSPRVAELTKVFENTYRAVNIALVNELAMLSDRMGLDVWEVLEAAATKPFGIQVFWPGPGVGGHCIPLDPFYLAWKAREYDFSTRFIELAAEINNRMPYFVKERLVRALSEAGKPLKGARVLLLGVAYKRDIDDARESPALKLYQLLEREGAHVVYHDPLVPEVRPHSWFQGHLHSVALSAALDLDLDLAVIVTDHSQVDYAEVVQRVPLIFDTRNVLKGVEPGGARVIRL